jgi:hypothetical protein
MCGGMLKLAARMRRNDGEKTSFVIAGKFWFRGLPRNFQLLVPEPGFISSIEYFGILGP